MEEFLETSESTIDPTKLTEPSKSRMEISRKMGLSLRIPKVLNPAIKDIGESFKQLHIAATLSWQDIAARYRRSKVGAFWLTIGMATMIATIGFVFGSLFNNSVGEFLPYLATGFIIWGFFTGLLTDGTNAFVEAEGLILQIKLPLFLHVLRVLGRNSIIFAHNFLLIPIVLIIFYAPWSFVSLMFLPGLLVLILNGLWMILILAIICARFRDLTQIVNNIITVLFYLTPIMWNKDMLPERLGGTIYMFNPFYHLLQITRGPLLGELPDAINWYVTILMIIVGWSIALLLFGKYYKRIAYWL